jgi:hypothetical protein
MSLEFQEELGPLSEDQIKKGIPSKVSCGRFLMMRNYIGIRDVMKLGY